MLKLENSIRGLSFSRVAFDLTIQDTKKQPFHRIAVYQSVLNYDLIPYQLYGVHLGLLGSLVRYPFAQIRWSI